MPYLGEFAAVATAVCWTFSSLYFALATKRVSGLPINQFRLLLAVPLLFLLQRVFEGVWWPLLPGDRLPQLVMSGLIGLVLGDIGYFYALFVIGPRISSVLMATWPAMAVAVQWLFRGEVPSFAMVVGIVTTCIGVILVLLRGNDSTSWQSKYALAMAASDRWCVAWRHRPGTWFGAGSKGCQQGVGSAARSARHQHGIGAHARSFVWHHFGGGNKGSATGIPARVFRSAGAI